MFSYDEFAKWADSALEKEIPENTIALNFNLYEESEEDTWAVQLIGSEKFDEDDEDWACYETFTTGEELYRWTEEGGWEKALETALENLKEYLSKGKYSAELLKYKGVGIGFVDGDICIVHSS
ncbi:MAG: hypothetical protein J6A37_10850 [Oscillospiraceae bacterium]|nr:hypothetical protein [Oscillospiraceae bacterium]